jgi:glycosyltransferase involved in cell wall biosynthesis
MRVLVVPKWYPWPEQPVFGIFCREHSRALAGRHDVVVLASQAVRRPRFRVFELSDSVEEGGIRTLRLRYRRPVYRPAALACQVAGMVVALSRLRRGGWRPQIVHAHVFSAGLPALLLGRLSGAPVVVSEHYTGFQRGLVTGSDALTARLAFRGADLVAPVSHDLARYVRSIQPRARVRVVGNVVDTDVFSPPARPQARAAGQPIRLLTVAALAAKKGHRNLLEALVSVRRTHDVVLDLVGEGDERAKLQELTRALGLDGSVRFHGELAKGEVAELMRQSDLFVLPSLYENLPVVLIEAMASGLPIVATSVGGVPELLDERAGLLCPPGDPAALAGAILVVLEGRMRLDLESVAAETRRRFGYAALERTWTAIYDQLRAERDGLG